MTQETFGSILGAIYRRRLTVVLVVAGALAGGYWFERKVGPDWQARATVMIPRSPPTISLASEAANVPDGPYLPDLTDELKVGALGVFSSGAVHERLGAKHPDLSLRAFRKNVRGNIDRFGNVEVLAYAPDAARAATFANDFADCFQDEMQEIAEASMRRALEAFRREEPLALEKFRGQHRALVDYLAQVGAVDLDAELRLLLEERRRLEEQVLELDLARVRADAERPVIESALAARPEFRLTGLTYRRNPAYEQALARTRELAAEIAVERLRLREGNPDLRRLEAELDQVRRDAVELMQQEMILDARAESADGVALQLASRLTDLDIAAAGYETQRGILETRRGGMDARLAGIPAYQSEVALRSAEMANARAIWEKISQRGAELEFHLRHGVRFTIMSPAMRARPENARRVPTTGGLYVFCLIAGLSGGLLLAVSAELLARLRARRPY